MSKRWVMSPSDYLLIAFCVAITFGVPGGLLAVLGKPVAALIVVGVGSFIASSFWTVGLIGAGVAAGRRSAP